jgi:hypothetical protein
MITFIRYAHDKQVILEETISQLQDGNTKLRTKMELIDMRLEEQEQYSGRTSLRFHNVRDLMKVIPETCRAH